jgi:acyl carrier protein
MALERRVKEIISDTLGLDPETVTAESDIIVDLGADSLDTVELLMEVEEEFGIEVRDEDAEKMRTVGDVVKYLKDQGVGEDE